MPIMLLVLTKPGNWQASARDKEQQQQRRSRRTTHRERQRHEDAFQQRKQGSNHHKTSQQKGQSFEYLKDKFQSFFSSAEGYQPVIQYIQPRHFVEGLVNTVLVSGTAMLIGTISFVGLPTFVWYNERKQPEGTNEEKQAKRVSQVVSSAIVGGILGTGFWLGGAAYGTYQLLAGFYHTPNTLWAWSVGKSYWKNGSWELYNLTEHQQELLEMSSSRRKYGV